MRSCLTEVVVVVVVVVAARGASQEGLSLTVADVQRLGQFLGELTHSLYANTASLCLLQDQGINGTTRDYWLLAGALSRNFVYVVPCGAPAPRPHPCLAYASLASRAACHKSNQVDIYVTDSKQMGVAMARVAERYQGSRGGVTQVVVGRGLRPPTQVQAGVRAWILASYTREERVVDVQEIFSFREPGASVVQQALGRWSAGTPLQLTHQPGLGPEDFMGNTVVLASFPYEPYFILAEKCTGSTHSDPATDHLHMRCVSHKPRHQLDDHIYVGYFIDMLDALSQKLNFTYRVVLPKDPEDYVFGTGSSDNYSGLVGMVVRQEADIVLASLSMSQERADSIDFSTSIDWFVRNLYIRANATKSSIGWGTYAKVLATPTWLGTIGVLLVTTCAMWLLSRGEREQVPPEILSYRDIVFMFFSCLVQQGISTTPVSVRGRAVFWMFWVTSVVLYAYYTARLTSYLAVSTVSLPFTSFHGAVAKYPEWQIGIMKGTPLRGFLKDAQGPTYQKLSSRLDENPHLLVDTEAEGVRRLLAGDYAYLTDSPIMQYSFMGNCSIREIQTKLFPNFGRLGYIKNLPFGRIFDKELTKLDDGGVLDRLRRRWSGDNVPCEEPSPFTELDFTHTITAFIILLLGIFFALILLFLERLVMKKRLHRQSAFEGEMRAWQARNEAVERRSRKRRWDEASETPPVYVAFVDKGQDHSLAY